MAASDDLTKVTEDIFDRFKESTLPLLQDLEDDMGTRREDYYNIALESSDKLADQQKAQAELRQSSMGVDLTDAQVEGQSRQESLGRTVTESTAVNQSVDVADQVNKDAAASLLNAATGIETQAINNLSSASGMASARQQQGYMNKQSASAANQQAAGSMVSLGIMYAMMA